MSSSIFFKFLASVSENPSTLKLVWRRWSKEGGNSALNVFFFVMRGARNDGVGKDSKHGTFTDVYAAGRELRNIMKRNGE